MFGFEVHTEKVGHKFWCPFTGGEGGEGLGRVGVGWVRLVSGWGEWGMVGEGGRVCWWGEVPSSLGKRLKSIVTDLRRGT